MARSFYRPAPSNILEDYEKNNRFFHAASNRHYRMLRRDGRFFQQRFQLKQGREVNLFEQEIHFIIGSGNHARSYLNLSAGGVLTQLPATWYPQEKRWGISPGYDRKQHFDFRARSITAACFATTPLRSLPKAPIATAVRTCSRKNCPVASTASAAMAPGSQHVVLASSGKVARSDSTGHCQSSPIES